MALLRAIAVGRDAVGAGVVGIDVEFPARRPVVGWLVICANEGVAEHVTTMVKHRSSSCSQQSVGTCFICEISV